MEPFDGELRAGCASHIPGNGATLTPALSRPREREGTEESRDMDPGQPEAGEAAGRAEMR